MKHALFFVHLVTHWIELSRVADLFMTRGDFRCTVMFAWAYDGVDGDISRCRERGIEVIEPPPRDAPRRSLWSRLRRVAAGATLAELCLVPLFPRLASWTAHYRAEVAASRALLDRLRPDLVVLPEDSVELSTGSLVHAARAIGIPALIVPFTISNAEENAEARWHDPLFSLSNWRNRLVGRLHPHWVRKHRGREILALAADRALAMERVGLAPPNPWVVNSGHAAAIAAEGPFMRRYYLDSSLPADRIVVTGALYDDLLVSRMAGRAERRARLVADYGLDPAKPLLVCALPPDQSATNRPDVEFASYDELLRAWAAALRDASGLAVAVKHHPRTPRRDIVFVEREFGLPVVHEDVVDLIPLCDAYAAYASATIRMAIACGVPVLHYDCHRFRYSDYLRVPGVVTCYDLPAFRAGLAVMADPRRRSDLAQRQVAFAADANVLDGRAGERLLALADSLVASASHASHP